MTIASVFKQSIWIANPTFSDADLPDQTGRVHIVTGGYGGVGFQLVRFLLARNATVHIAGRSPTKFTEAAQQLAHQLGLSSPSSLNLHFLQVDLSDVNSVISAADHFLNNNSRLDVLTNNAGIMNTHPHALSAQGIEMQLATNVLGPWVFTHRLWPLLEKTASRPEVELGSVRVTFAGSLAVNVAAMLPTSYHALEAEYPSKQSRRQPTSDSSNSVTVSTPVPSSLVGLAAINYLRSKVGNVYLAEHFAARSGSVTSVVWNPGNLKTELTRHTPSLAALLVRPLLYPAIKGGYTELAAGWSPTVEAAYRSRAVIADTQGGVRTVFVVPWGQVVELPDSVKRAITVEKRHEEVVEWCRGLYLAMAGADPRQ